MTPDLTSLEALATAAKERNERAGITFGNDDVPALAAWLLEVIAELRKAAKMLVEGMVIVEAQQTALRRLCEVAIPLEGDLKESWLNHRDADNDCANVACKDLRTILAAAKAAEELLK